LVKTKGEIELFGNMRLETVKPLVAEPLVTEMKGQVSIDEWVK